MADLHDFVAKKDKKKKGTKMFSKVNTDVMAKNLEETASKDQKQNQDKEITNTGDVVESSYVPSSETMADNECKLFIHGVDSSYKDQEVQDQFEKFGPVTDTHNTGKEYAFLTFADKSSAQTAIQEMDGAIVNGKNIQVHKFKAKEGSRHGDRKHGGRKDFVAKLSELSLEDRKSNSGPDENIEQFSGGLICMDLLNFSRSFFTILKGPKSKYISFENDLRTAQSKAARFVKAATASGFELICFIDKGISTLEAINKWLSRRMKELEKGRRDVVASMNLFMGNMFARLGVPVHYSTVDCDDTIAAFAHHHGGCVLSQDADFFRYYVDNNNADAASQVSVPPYKVYSDFQIKKGKLILKRQFEPASKKPRTPRKILEELPETVTDNSFVLCSVPSGTLGWKGGIALMRGCGSNLTHLTNPHLQVRLHVDSVGNIFIVLPLAG